MFSFWTNSRVWLGMSLLLVMLAGGVFLTQFSSLQGDVTYTSCPNNVCVCSGTCEYTFTEGGATVQCANGGKMVVRQAYVTKTVYCYNGMGMEGSESSTCSNVGGECWRYPEQVDCPAVECSNGCSGTNQCAFGNSWPSCGDPMWGCGKDYHFVVECLPANGYSCGATVSSIGSSASMAVSSVASNGTTGGTGAGTGAGGGTGIGGTGGSSAVSQPQSSAASSVVSQSKSSVTSVVSVVSSSASRASSSRSSASVRSQSSASVISTNSSNWSIGGCSSMPPLPDAVCANSVDFFIHETKMLATFLRCQADALDQHLICNDCEYRSYMEHVPLLKECVAACGTPLYYQLYGGEECVSAEQQKACYDSCHDTETNCMDHPPADISIADKTRYAAQCADKAASCFQSCPVYCPVCPKSSQSSVSSHASSVSSHASSRSSQSSQVSQNSSTNSSTMSRVSSSVRSSQQSLSSGTSSNFSASHSAHSFSNSFSALSQSSDDYWIYDACAGYSSDDLSNCAFTGQSCPGEGVFTGETCGKKHYQNEKQVSQEVGLCCTKLQTSSSSVYPPSGVCCEAGNCNPFGTCSNPLSNFAACVQACGTGSSSISQSSNGTRSSSAFSRSSISIHSSNASQSSNSAQRSSLQSQSSRSNSSHTFGSSIRSNPPIFLQLSSGRNTGIDNNLGGVDGVHAGTVNGNGGAIGTTLTVGAGGGIADAVFPIDSCISDADCREGTRCILHRCLTTTDIAALPTFCGNARIDVGEICDDGPSNSDKPNAACRTNCIPARCGDGVIDMLLEQCDDGGNTMGDGCSSTCMFERNASDDTQTLPATAIELPFMYRNNDSSGRDIQGMGDEFTGEGNGYNGQGNGSTNADSNVNSATAAGMQGSVIYSSIPSTPDTGPAALVIMLAGGAAGWLYRRRR